LNVFLLSIQRRKRENKEPSSCWGSKIDLNYQEILESPQICIFNKQDCF
jgi:hypothetical protein